MYSKVIELRRFGRRRPDHDVAADAGAVGFLTMHTVASYTEMLLRDAVAHATGRLLLSPLYDAAVVNIGSGRMLFRGFQKDGPDEVSKQPSYMQEWIVEPLGDYLKRPR